MLRRTDGVEAKVERHQLPTFPIVLSIILSVSALSSPRSLTIIFTSALLVSLLHDPLLLLVL